MKKLQPIYYIDSVFEIDQAMLEGLQKKVLFIDVDNTLFVPKVSLAVQDIEQAKTFLVDLLASGFEIVAISNNFTEDRKLFFQDLGIPFIYFARKPLSVGFKKAFKEIRNTTIEKKDIIHIGDQVLTDGFGARLFGVEYILVEPINHKHDLIFALPSRVLERCIGLEKKKRGK